MNQNNSKAIDALNEIESYERRINEYVLDNVNICLDQCFGLWVDKLWYTNLTAGEETTFQDEKEIFFRTFQLLLEEGKIIVVEDFVCNSIPGGYYDTQEGKKQRIKGMGYTNIPAPTLEPFPKDPRYNYWNAEAKYIVDHIRIIFPKDATVYDMNVGNWFYGFCPAIGWVDQETGEVTAS